MADWLEKWNTIRNIAAEVRLKKWMTKPWHLITGYMEGQEIDPPKIRYRIEYFDLTAAAKRKYQPPLK
jgi:hypothetical protein